MTRRTSRYFWGTWPYDSQKRFFKVILVGSMLAALAIVIGLTLFSSSLDQQIEDSKEQYGRVVPLVGEINALRAQMGVLAHLSVEDAIWELIDDLVIEDKLTSIRSTKLEDGTMGIQVTFTGLSLPKLAKFMRDMRDKAALQTPDCAITRNPDDPRLADAHFVLAR